MQLNLCRTVIYTVIYIVFDILSDIIMLLCIKELLRCKRTIKPMWLLFTICSLNLIGTLIYHCRYIYIAEQFHVSECDGIRVHIRTWRTSHAHSTPKMTFPLLRPVFNTPNFTPYSIHSEIMQYPIYSLLWLQPQILNQSLIMLPLMRPNHHCTYVQVH